MVTRRVIRISAKEAEALKPDPPEEASSVMAAVAVVDSSPDNNHDNITQKQSKKREKPEKPLCTHPSCTKRAQDQSPLCWKHDAQARNIICKFTGCNKKGILQGLCPDHGGLVQLCQSRGCINKANLEKRGGLCWIHRTKGQHDDDSSEEEEAEEIRLCRIRGCISCATTCEGLCNRHSTQMNDEGVEKKKRSHQSVDSISVTATTKRRRVGAFFVDLTDVPPQLPTKSSGRIKCASKYTGVSFDKQINKWKAQIEIDGKARLIGSYENEEEAAVDYALALFKYRGQRKLGKVATYGGLDLKDIPDQPLIHSETSKSGFKGVKMNRKGWRASLNGKTLGTFDTKEEAAAIYARARCYVEKEGNQLKEKKQKAVCDRHSTHANNEGVVGEKKRSHQSVDSISDGATKKRRKEGAFFIDLTDVPPQLPIPKSVGHMKSGTSKYTGTRFNEKMKKWTAQIKIDGKVRRIGSYENEEEAAVDYARALFKYRGQGELDKATEKQEELVTVIDISDVPPQPPILKTAGRSGASKYTGVSFVKKTNKWSAQIMIGKKQNCIGYYDNEEDAAVDYARALFKYKRNAITRPPQNSFIIDLDDVPPQPLILKNDLSRSKKYNDNTRRRNVNKGSSKYTGVYFAKDVNKWKAQIMIDGNVRSIGYYEIEEEAAADYARAAFKYKAKKGYATYGGLDLEDIPDQPLIHSETNKSGFKGVKNNKSRWEARLNERSLGTFDTKEEAAGIYARARYYVESQEKQSKKKKQKAAVALTEESFESVAV